MIETYRVIVNIALSRYIVSTVEFNINVFLYYDGNCSVLYHYYTMSNDYCSVLLQVV